jgi:hypothetical protein
MKKPFYVCGTCGQDFTRKYNAYRHNQNIHFGTAQIVPFFEYLVQRSSGKYLPCDPLSYRLKRRQNMFVHNENNNNTSKEQKSGSSTNPAYGSNGNRSRDTLYGTNNSLFNRSISNNVVNNNNPYAQLFNFMFSQQEPDKKAEESSLPEEAYRQAKVKLAEIEQLLITFYPQEFVRNVITGLIKRCNATGDYSILDEALENHRRRIAY